MIVDINTGAMLNESTPTHSDSPPTYESVSGTSVSAPHSAPPQTTTKDAGVGPQSTQPKMPPLMIPGAPHPTTYGAMATSATTTVYHYLDPRTGQTIPSLLPPDHPQMVCLQEGQHIPESRYGFLGVLAAIVWFPLGIGLCLLDRRVRCQRCGESLEDGLCS